MSIVQRHATRTARSSLMKLLIIVVIAAVAGLVWMDRSPELAVPAAQAGEMQAAGAGRAADPQRKSWSDEWYDVHKAIVDMVTEDAPTF